MVKIIKDKVDYSKYTKYVLALMFSLVLTIINSNFVNLTLNRHIINLTLKGKTKNLIEIYPNIIKIVHLIYSPVIFMSLTIFFLIVINFILMQKPKTEKKEVPILYPEKIPYDQEVEEFEIHLGAIHNDRDLEITSNPKLCTISLKNILKNFVIFGVIGEGKTASGLLPILQQIIYYSANNSERKIGGFITDVKGNFSEYVVKYAKDVGRDDDIILFRICGEYYYNFLYKPGEPASVIAWRLTEYLKAHNASGNESYWVDQAKAVMEEGIKLIRLANDDGYITFEDLDCVIVNEEERALIIEGLYKKYESGKLTKYERELFLSAKSFFENKFVNLGDKVIGIIISEVDRIVRTFTSDPLVKETFCPPKEKLNFPGFRQILEEGKLFIFDIPNERFKGVAGMACSFAKLDWQSVSLQRMSNKEYNQDRICFSLSDENHFIATPNDPDYYSLARESKCFSIVAVQSISSYLTVLKNENLVNNMLNNLDNKLFMRNTDPKTLDYCLKVLGKEVKTYQNRSTSESGKTDIDYLASNITQDNKSISQSVSEADRKEEVFTQEFFTRVLDEFQAVGLVNSGKVLAPIHLFKYWENKITNNYTLKKATVNQDFVFAPYLTTQEMINKINNEELINIKDEEKNIEEKNEMFVIGDKDKVELEKFIDNSKEIDQKNKQVMLREGEQQEINSLKTNENKINSKSNLKEASSIKEEKDIDIQDSLFDIL